MYRKFIATWLITAMALILVGNFIPGFIVRNTTAGINAALILGFITAICRPTLLIFTAFPVSVFSFSLFVFIFQSTTVWLTSILYPSFEVAGFLPAVISAIVAGLIGSWLNTKFAKQDD